MCVIFKFHFDIDQSSINKNVKVDYHTNTDITLSLKAINEHIESRGVNFDQSQYDQWWRVLTESISSQTKFKQSKEKRSKTCFVWKSGQILQTLLCYGQTSLNIQKS